ncbi:MAG: glycosyltransferase family 4 protein [Alistipes sp.]|nr:glycosyltransferase family 4 protein [Alistipes sp.]
MKRNHTIGFDARNANVGDTSLSCYARYVIGAMADAYPRYCYFRMYVPRSEDNDEYDALAQRHNVESLLPDGGIWRKVPWLWHLLPIGRDMTRGDVELYHSLTTTLPYGLARRNIRSVVTVHSLDFLRLRGHSTRPSSIYRRIAMAETLRRADRIVAVSQCVKRDIAHLLHIDSDKIDVIYRGCHQRFNKPITEQKINEVVARYNLPERYMLFRGTQHAYKNIAHIIEAMPNISTDLHLVCVGRATSHTEHVLHRIKSLGLQDRVHMLYGAAEEDIPAIYSKAMIFVMPSRYEGFSTEIVEALTMGVPVVASRGSSLEEAGGPDSIYTSATDHEELARAVEQLYIDEDMRKAMAEAGREYASRFRPELMAYNLQNCYRRIGIDIKG